MTYNYLFCINDDYEFVKTCLDRDLSLMGSYVHVNADPLGDNFEKTVKTLLVNGGYYCILTRFPDKCRKSFPNNVVDLNIHIDNPLKAAKEVKYCLTNFGKDLPMTNNTFFTSDSHFYHGNIIKYCARPFADVDEMNNRLIDNWNSVVSKDDIVWHLGDFSFGKKDNIFEVFPKLNGKINLVMGNHDHEKIKFYYDVGFHRVYDRPIVVNNFVVLSHAPLEWVKAPMFNIFGHVHDNSIYSTWSINGCCVCVERHEYKPVSWKTIHSKFNEMSMEV